MSGIFNSPLLSDTCYCNNYFHIHLVFVCGYICYSHFAWNTKNAIQGGAELNSVSGSTTNRTDACATHQIFAQEGSGQLVSVYTLLYGSEHFNNYTETDIYVFCAFLSHF